MPGGFRSGRLRKAQACSGGVVEAEARVRVDGSQPIVVPSVPPRATQAAPPAATRRNPRRVVLAVQASFLTRPSMSAPRVVGVSTVSTSRRAAPGRGVTARRSPRLPRRRGSRGPQASPEGNALPPRLPGQKIIYEKANICKAPVVCSAFATGVVCAENSAERRKAAHYSTSLKLRNVGRYKVITWA
jgi:hypothetical protein